MGIQFLKSAEAVKSGRAALLIRTALVGVSAFGFAGLAQAQVAGITGFNGQVATGETAPTLTNTTSTATVTVEAQRTVVNWNTFDVAAKEKVRFDFTTTTDSKNAIVFNRVVTPGASATINGGLEGFDAGGVAGNIWVYAPGGVVFGATSSVSALGFLATSHDMTAVNLSAWLSSSTGNTANFSVGGTGAISVATGSDWTKMGSASTNGMVTFIAPSVSLGAMDIGSADKTTALVVLAAGAGELTTVGGTGTTLGYSNFAATGSAGASPVTTTGNISASSILVQAFSPSKMAASLISVGGKLTATGDDASKLGNVAIIGDTGSVKLAGDVTGAGRVTVTAGGDITINSGVTVRSDNDDDAATAGAGDLTISAGGNVLASGSALAATAGTANGASVATTGKVSIVAASMTGGSIRGANVTLEAKNGNVEVTAVRANAATAATIDIKAKGTGPNGRVSVAALANNSSSAGTTTVLADGGAATITTAALNSGTLGSDLTVTSTGDLTLGTADVDGKVVATSSAGKIAVTSLTTDHSAGLKAATGITLTSATSTNTNGSGNVSLNTTAGGAEIGKATVGGAIGATAGDGDIKLGTGGTITAETTAGFVANKGSISVSDSLTAKGAVVLNAGTDVNVTSGKVITADSDINGKNVDNLTINAGGNVNAAGANLLATANKATPGYTNGSSVYVTGKNVSAGAARGMQTYVNATAGDLTVTALAAYDTATIAASAVASGKAWVGNMETGRSGLGGGGQVIASGGDAVVGENSASGGVVINGDLTVTSGGGAAKVGSGTVEGKITVQGLSADVATKARLASAGTISITSTVGSVTAANQLDSSSAGNSIVITSAKNVTTGANLIALSIMNIAAVGTVDFAKGPIQSLFAGSLNVTAGEDIIIRNQAITPIGWSFPVFPNGIAAAGALTLSAGRDVDFQASSLSYNDFIVSAGRDIKVASGMFLASDYGTGFVPANDGTGKMKLTAGGSLKAAGAEIASVASGGTPPFSSGAKATNLATKTTTLEIQAGTGVEVAALRGASVTVVTTKGDVKIDALKAVNGSASATTDAGSITIGNASSVAVNGDKKGEGDMTFIAKGGDVTVTGTASAGGQLFASSTGTTTVATGNATVGAITLLGKSIASSNSLTSSQASVNLIASAGWVAVNNVAAAGSLTINATGAVTASTVQAGVMSMTPGDLAIVGSTISITTGVYSYGSGKQISLVSTTGDITTPIVTGAGFVNVTGPGAMQLGNVTSRGLTVSGTDILLLSLINTGGTAVNITGSGAVILGATTSEGDLNITGKSVNMPFSTDASCYAVSLKATGGNISTGPISANTLTQSATGTISNGTVTGGLCDV